jgi:hypothetical protein
MADNEIRVPTCRSEAKACPEGQGCAAAAAALVSYALSFAAAWTATVLCENPHSELN